jgi:hypothetical protein
VASTQRGERLTISYQALVASLGGRLAAILASAWATVHSTDDAAVRRWLAVVVPSVLAAQARAVVLSDAYLSAYSTAEGTVVSPVGLAAADFTGGRLRGVPIESVYRRPVEAAQRAAEAGAALAGALAAERSRVITTAATDVQLAARAARSGWGQRVPQVTAWRRSLGGGQHCALCSSAAGTIYRTDVVMPIHDHCTCVTEPVLIGEGPQLPIQRGAINDSPGLRDTALAGEQVARVEDHGELGPVLVAVGQTFSP